MRERSLKSGFLQRFGLKSAKALLALAGATVLLSAAHAGAEELPANEATNGGFESDMTGWTRSDTAATTAWSSTTNPRKGSNAFNWWHDAGFTMTVSQTVTGLEDGRYALTGYSQGGGGEAVARLFAEADGAKQTADFRNTGYLQWIETTIPTIGISTGSVTIGFEITGAAGQWGSIDDLTLVRVGDLEAEPATIVSLQPVAVDTLLHEAPVLPAIATAEMSDGGKTQLPVEWDPVEPARWAAAGSFEVEGTVQGATELRAVATVSVGYRSFDVNGDGAADAGDLAILSYHMGLAAGGPSDEEKQCDFNNDGSLTIEDAALLMDEMLERK